MKITTKISLSFYAVTVICTLAALFFLYFTARQLLRTTGANLETAARSQTKHIETYLSMLKTTAEQLAENMILENLLNLPDNGNLQQTREFALAMQNLRDADEANPSVHEFLLLNKAGRVVASSNEKDVGSNQSMDASFLGGQDGSFVKDAYYQERMQQPMISVSAPLVGSQNDEFLGVLVARVTLDDLWNITSAHTKFNESGEIYIVNKHGLLITPSRFLKDTFLKRKINTEEVRQAFLHKDTRFIANILADYRGKQVLGAHGYIPEMQWAVIAKIDADEAFAPLIKLRRILILIIAIMALTSWLLSRHISKKIAAPIDKLHKGIEIIGRGNFDYKVGTDAADEVGQLSRAFDKMTASLKTTTTSIANLNNEIAERKRTEDYLRIRTAELFESEEDLTITLRSIGDALIATDTLGRITRMNPVAERLTGWSLGEAVDKPLDDIFHIVNSQTQLPSTNPIAKVLTSGQFAGLANHTTLIARNGTRYQITDCASPIRDMNGCVRGVVLIFHDVSNEYRIREDLQQSEERFRSLVSNSPVTIYRCKLDANMTMLYISAGIEALCGHPAEEFIDNAIRSYSSIIHPDDRQLVDSTLKASLSQKSRYMMEHRICCADGAIKWVQSQGRGFFNAEGKLLWLDGIITDITERRQIEDSIRKAKDGWERTFDSAPDLLCLMDDQYTITRMNHTMANTLGIKREDAIGKKCYTCIHHADKAPDSCPHRQMMADGKEHQAEIKDDTLNKWLLVSVAPLRNEQGDTIGAIHVAHDITERKQAEEALRQSKNELEKAYRKLQESFELETKLAVQAQSASAAKSQFVANISHEIRTPLNGIIGICELLLETKMTKAQLDYAKIININAEALLNIINATLDFAKIEAGKMGFEHINFNLGNILDDIVGVLSVNAAKKKLQLSSTIESNVPHNLNGDPGRLRQILINLIGNAIKFTQAGEITVKVTLAQAKAGQPVLRFTVRDTGIGIPSDKTHLLFNAFCQVDASMARKFGGTGLGLAISKGLVEQMGGTIGVESVPGQGSTFWFIVPFLTQPPEAQQTVSQPESDTAPAEKTDRHAQQPEQVQPEQRLRILVAEDNMANQMIILGILKKMGHTAVAVADGNEAVKALETIPYDLVLMDIQMPEMDGFEAATIIRNLQSAVLDHNIPILALTANTMEVDREKRLAAGMNGHILKPVNTKSIANAIAQIISTKLIKTVKTESKITSPHVFDFNTFSERLSGDQALMREVANVFMAETPKSLCALESAIRNQTKDEAVRLAHTIKGSAANLGGDQLRAVAFRIEKACTASDWRDAQALMPRINKQYEFLEQAIRDLVKI